jgi:hypothetical protein
MKQLSPSRVGVSLGLRIYPRTALAGQIARLEPQERDRVLLGHVAGNPEFIEPVYYLSPELGDDPEGYVLRTIAGDQRFFLPSKAAEHDNYNYNDNKVLIEAICQGYRGAFWDILRRLTEGDNPAQP